MEIVKYEHHGVEVSVMAEHKGTHRAHCLCYSCKFFRPTEDTNCPIAQQVYDTCVEYGLTTPVFECPEFEVKDES